MDRTGTDESVPISEATHNTEAIEEGGVLFVKTLIEATNFKDSGRKGEKR